MTSMTSSQNVNYRHLVVHAERAAQVSGLLERPAQGERPARAACSQHYL
jgi:hypothetical protein